MTMKEKVQNLFPYPWHLSFWFWWFALTGAYLMIGISNIAKGFGALIGLFVPYGVYNSSYTFQKVAETGSVLPLASLALFFSIFLLVDKILWRKKLQPFEKIALNLTILFLLTICVDLSIWGEWESCKLAFSSGFPMCSIF